MSVSLGGVSGLGYQPPVMPKRETIKNAAEENADKASPAEKTALAMSREALNQQKLYMQTSANANDGTSSDQSTSAEIDVQVSTTSATSPTRPPSPPPTPAQLPTPPNIPGQTSLADALDSKGDQLQRVRNYIEEQTSQKASPDEKTALVMSREALQQQELYAAVYTGTDVSDSPVSLEVQTAQGMSPATMQPVLDGGLGQTVDVKA